MANKNVDTIYQNLLNGNGYGYGGGRSSNYSGYSRTPAGFTGGIQALLQRPAVGIDFMAIARGQQMAKDVAWQNRVREIETLKQADKMEQREDVKSAQAFLAPILSNIQRGETEGNLDRVSAMIDNYRQAFDSDAFSGLSPNAQWAVGSQFRNFLRNEANMYAQAGDDDSATRLRSAIGLAYNKTDTYNGSLGQTAQLLKDAGYNNFNYDAATHSFNFGDGRVVDADRLAYDTRRLGNIKDAVMLQRGEQGQLAIDREKDNYTRSQSLADMEAMAKLRERLAGGKPQNRTVSVYDGQPPATPPVTPQATPPATDPVPTTVEPTAIPTTQAQQTDWMAENERKRDAHINAVAETLGLTDEPAVSPQPVPQQVSGITPKAQQPDYTQYNKITNSPEFNGILNDKAPMSQTELLKKRFAPEAVDAVNRLNQMWMETAKLTAIAKNDPKALNELMRRNQVIITNLKSIYQANPGLERGLPPAWMYSTKG